MKDAWQFVMLFSFLLFMWRLALCVNSTGLRDAQRAGKIDKWIDRLSKEDLANVGGVIQSPNRKKKASHSDFSVSIIAWADLL